MPGGGLHRTKRAKLDLPIAGRRQLTDIGGIIAAGIVDNIRRQQKADGTPIKANRSATIEKKIREGKPLLALVDTHHRFVKGGKASWAVLRVLPKVSAVIVGPATEELGQLIRWVSRKGYTGYIGVSAKTEGAIRAYIRKWLRRQFRRRR